jgi:VanZ family protein
MTAADAISPSPAGASRLPAVLWMAFALFIVYGGLVPFRFTTDRAFVAAKLARVTLNPLVSPDTGRRVSMPDVAQNVLLFLPFGLFGALALKGRPFSNPGVIAVAGVTVLAAVLSAGVEAAQLFTVDRTTSVSDLAANTLGALLGALVAQPSMRLWLRARAASGTRAALVDPAFYPVILAAVLVCATAWEPFDATLDVGDVVGKLRALRLDPWQFTSLGDEILETTRYALFGMAMRFWLVHALKTARAATAWAAFIGIAAALLLEGSQILISSRMPGLEDASVHAAAAVGGVLTAVGWPHRRSPLFWWAMLTVLTAAGAAVEFRLPPQSDPMATISRLFELTALCAPIGFCYPSPRTDRPIGAALLAAVLLVAAVVVSVEPARSRVPLWGVLMLILAGAAGGVFCGATWRALTRVRAQR